MLNDPVNLVDPLGLKVSISWSGLHPSISIVNSSNPSLNGKWAFGPDIELSNKKDVLKWLAGMQVKGKVYSGDNPCPEGNVIYDSDNFDQWVYDRIMESKNNPPNYSYIQYNCMDWVNDMLYGKDEN